MTVTPQDDDLLAAEYVLGTLPLEERIAVEARAKTDAGLATSIAQWEQRLLPLTNDVPSVAPSPELLNRIESRLFPSSYRRPWFASFWAGFAVSLATLVVAVFLAISVQNAKPTLTATLAPNASGVSYLAEVTQAGIILTLSGPAPDSAQVHELWLINGDAAPVSLGLIGTKPLPLPATLAPGMILAVSLEPAGGSTTGAPTGPVLALGPLEEI